MNKMEYVVKRNGEKEAVDFSKVYQRIERMTFGLAKDQINVHAVSKAVIQGIFNGVTTEELDNLTVKVAGAMTVEHPDYGILAGRIAVSNLRKKCPPRFSEAVAKLYLYEHPKVGEQTPLVSKELFEAVMADPTLFNDMIVDERDWEYNIFAVETLKKSYLLKCGDEPVETPQYLHMRVAIGISLKDGVVDIENVRRTYEAISTFKYTHATPTLFNAGTPHPQLASCFLIKNKGDSIEGIYGTLAECAQISKHAGGIGLSFHDVRSAGAFIKGNGGTADGIVPALRNFNETARYVNQGGKRKGAIAIYLEPHHADIFDFLDLRKGHGAEERRCRDLFIAVWLSDLFMERCKNNADWTLFDPSTAPGLNEVYGEEYVRLYEQYEFEGRGVRTVKAQELWNSMCVSQIETGTPYVLNKDAVNQLSNQKNLGTIESSNLCSEVCEYTSKDESSVCQLASINLSAFVREDGTYDYEGLADMASLAVQNLNRIINIGFYPVETARRSMMRHRPVGLGVNALADVYFKLRLPFDSPEAEQLNRNMAEALYYGAVRQSVEEAKRDGPYSTFAGSPASEGKLQMDLWRNPGVNTRVTDERLFARLRKSTLGWEDRWDKLRADVVAHGLRNSLLTAYMPTASSATLLGVYEAFEPQTSNIYRRSVLSGEFAVVNKYLVEDLVELGMWTPEVRNSIIANDGSIQHLEQIPEKMRAVYKTVWEMSMKALIDQSFDRSQYVDQSQSLNMFMKDPTVRKITSMLFYSWARGLKTMLYYLRSRSSAEAQKFTLAAEPSCTSCTA
jgi:ribonucleoside-diphosphate reductase alpha subunit